MTPVIGNVGKKVSSAARGGDANTRDPCSLRVVANSPPNKVTAGSAAGRKRNRNSGSAAANALEVPCRDGSESRIAGAVIDNGRHVSVGAGG